MNKWFHRVQCLHTNKLFIIYLVTPDTLTDMANQMTEKVGLVHGLPYVADRQGFAATLEQVSAILLSFVVVSFQQYVLPLMSFLKIYLFIIF